MGRGVSTASGAVAIVYIDVSEYDQDTWDDFIEDVRNVVKERYPTFEDDKKWVGREDRSVLLNGHALVTVSEYCGLVSVCLVPREDESGYGIVNGDLATAWCNRIADGFVTHLHKCFPSTALTRMGTFSNGESIYQLASE